MREKRQILILVAEIQDELGRLGQIKEKLSLQRDLAENEERLESAALRLHNFYTGCERIFKLIAVEVNGSVPDRFDWHKRLLIQASLSVNGVRPAIISDEVRQTLEELLAFRHLVRSIYGYELDPDRVQTLIDKAIRVFPDLNRDLACFLDFLQELSQEI